MPLLSTSPDALSEYLADIAWQAGCVLRSLRRNLSHVSTKDDGSPVTEADRQAEKIILARLQELWPAVPVVAEESGGKAGRDELFFMVDPLDGTRDYIRPEGEYTVNIALIHKQRPVAAAIAAPEDRHVWIAGEQARVLVVPDGPECLQGQKLHWQTIKTRSIPREGGIALVSRRRNDQSEERIMDKLPIVSRQSASSAIKFCWIASGQADIYVRCRPTMEWDTAAGDHILACAGGTLFGRGGAPFLYGRQNKGYLNGAFAAIGDRTLEKYIDLP